MNVKNHVLEIEDVSSVSLYPDGKCIITLTSLKIANEISTMKEKITYIKKEIDQIEQKIKKDNEYSNKRVNDINNKLLKERFDGLNINMQSMFEALKEKIKNM